MPLSDCIFQTDDIKPSTQGHKDSSLAWNPRNSEPMTIRENEFNQIHGEEMESPFMMKKDYSALSSPFSTTVKRDNSDIIQMIQKIKEAHKIDNKFSRDAVLTPKVSN